MQLHSVLVPGCYVWQPTFCLGRKGDCGSDCQREGIGKSLMDYMEDFFLQQNCSKIMLQTNSDNRAARDFYSAMGYDPDAKIGFIKYHRYFGQ